MMNWKGCGRKGLWPNGRYYPSTCMNGLRKTTKNISQDSRPPGRDLNPGLPEYKALCLNIEINYQITRVKLITNPKCFNLYWVIFKGTTLFTPYNKSHEIVIVILIIPLVQSKHLQLF
jgi:hypothetical protein